jgi:pimeloyl-ACP methyl ester carboxylesterase
MSRARLSLIHQTVWLLLLLLACGLARAAPPMTITVGTVELTYCNTVYLGYCGSIKRPLDPTGSVAGTIKIGFEYYPRHDQSRPAIGTILPQEGGPGYSSTGTRDAYVNIFEPLRERRDILIVDKRGTGTSGAIGCALIQKGDPNNPASIKACGEQLGDRTALYRTELAVADIVGVMDALQIHDVDYYGDSYGTYVGQTFAARYPNRLRSIILDSAYPVRAPDAWFPTDWRAGTDGLDLVCARSPPCRSLGGTSIARIKALLDELRQHSISGTAPDANGIMRKTTVDVPMLFLLMDDLGASPSTYRDLDSAARAWFDSNDAVPLLRLAAEYNTAYPADSPVDFSYGLYQDVVCEEYPLFYSLSATPAQRRQQYARAIASARANRPNLFAPFTIDEALASGANATPLATCLDWPQPIAAYPQGDALPAHPVFPAVPTLVLSGDLDSVTSVADANQAARQFPDVIHLVIPNLTHVTAWYFSDVGLLPDGGDTTNCVQAIVRRFVVDLAPGDTSCISGVRPIRTVPRFAKSASELDPVDARAGNEANPSELRLATAALETVGDVFARFLLTFGEGGGLRGGKFSYVLQPYGYAFEFNHVKWTEDLEITGAMQWYLKANTIAAEVQLWQNGKSAGNLNIAWNDLDVDAIATLTGTIGTDYVNARRIAP